MGLEAEFVEIAWETKELELAAKSIDCIWNGMTITPERAEAMSITVPYMANKQVVVAKAENAEKYATAEGIENVVIVAEAESAGEEVATSDAFFSKASYTAVDSQAKALMEVSSGTAGACVVDYVASIGMIGEGTDYENLVVVPTGEFSPEEYGVAFRKGSDITEKVNAAMKEASETYLKDVLGSEKLVFDIIKKELIEVKEKFGDSRKTKIVAAEGEFEIEDLIKEEQTVITLSHFGYVKRMPIDTYKSQRRGGKGVIVYKPTPITGMVKGAALVSDEDNILIIGDKTSICIAATDIPALGRASSGNQMIKNGKVIAVSKI